MPEVTLQQVYDAINGLRTEVSDRMNSFEKDYRTCSTCNERHKVIEWLLKASLTAVVVETLGLVFFAIRTFLAR